ncbi:hypothetical protein GN956_G19186 [Arapaima gigas]
MAENEREQNLLRIFSWNINGMKGQKRDSKLDKINRLNADIVLLQETHVKNCKQIERDFPEWETLFTESHTGRRGVAILVRKTLNASIFSRIKDTESGYAVMSFKLRERTYTFVSVYHHSDDSALTDRLSKDLSKVDKSNLVIGGDFNTALSDWDRTSTIRNWKHRRINRFLTRFMRDFDLVDIWRRKHPDERQYTYKYPKEQRSRLDYFFIHETKSTSVISCEINNLEISDHSSLSLTLQIH